MYVLFRFVLGCPRRRVWALSTVYECSSPDCLFYCVNPRHNLKSNGRKRDDQQKSKKGAVEDNENMIASPNHKQRQKWIRCFTRSCNFQMHRIRRRRLSRSLRMICTWNDASSFSIDDWLFILGSIFYMFPYRVHSIYFFGFIFEEKHMLSDNSSRPLKAYRSSAES